MSDKVASIYSLSFSELETELVLLGQPRFRAKQVWKYLYSEIGWGFDNATVLPVKLREQLSGRFNFVRGKLVDFVKSPHGEAVKFLLDFGDNSIIETVLLNAPKRKTVCISTQVGCDLGCAFCASTIGGKLRDLEFHEIIDQFVAASSISEGQITNIVIMGMGEPLRNYDNLVKALRIFTSPKCFGISGRRITVSTIGVIPAIKKLAGESLNVSLAISLHAPNQAVREDIVPSAHRWGFEEILTVAGGFQKTTGRQVTLEYCLLEGVNDLKAHAEQLARRIRGNGFAVNLIPFNPVKDIGFKRPSPERVKRFKEAIASFGIPVTVRYEKGSEISAACGQLMRDRTVQ